MERIHETKPYLLAAADVLAKQQNKTKEPVENLLSNYGLSSTTVKQWFDVLERAAEEPDNVFYPLAKLAKPPAEGEPTGFDERLSVLRDELREWTARADPNHPFQQERGDVVFEDFDGPGYRGSTGGGDWTGGGGAFGDGPSTYIAPNLAAAGYQGTGAANSFASGSNHWTGILTSTSARYPSTTVVRSQPCHRRSCPPNRATRSTKPASTPRCNPEIARK